MLNNLIKVSTTILFLNWICISNVVGQSKKEVQEFKTTITNVLDAWEGGFKGYNEMHSEENGDKSRTWLPNEGIRGHYFYQKKNLSLEIAEGLVGEPIFLKGPHKKKMDFEATTFGYYNPKFLKKLNKLLTELLADKVWVTKYRAAYYSSIQDYLNTYKTAYNLVIKNEEKVQIAIKEYEEKLSSEATVRLTGSREDWNRKYEIDKFSVDQCVNFWVRRYADKTSKDFHSLLELVTDAFENQSFEIEPFSIGITPNFMSGCYGFEELNFKKGATPNSYWISSSNHKGILDENTRISIENIKKQKIEVFERTVFRNALSFGSDGGYYFDEIDADTKEPKVESTGDYYTAWEKLELDDKNSFGFKDTYRFWAKEEVLAACPTQPTADKGEINEYFLKRMKGMDHYESWSEEDLEETIKNSQEICKRAVQIQIRYTEKGKEKAITCTFFLTIGPC
ncbi:MAG: hypothetical protein GY810_17685 [Aureispira sp.]|nr:hypothetical protein [Aureispira sp.]